MNILEARQLESWIAGMEQFLASQKEDMVRVKETLTTFTNLDNSLTGEGGDAIKLFYRENHLPLLLFYEATVNQFLSFMKDYNRARESFDASHTAYINTSFLEHELPLSLQSLRNQVADTVDSLNSQSRSVADIVYLPTLIDQQFFYGVEAAINKCKETANYLQQFDQQQLSKLSSLQHDI